MSRMIRKAATSISSTQCTRIVAPVVMRPFTATSHRNYAAHQAEESYDAFNERYCPRRTLCGIFEDSEGLTNAYE